MGSSGAYDKVSRVCMDAGLLVMGVDVVEVMAAAAEVRSYDSRCCQYACMRSPMKVVAWSAMMSRYLYR